MKHTPSFKPHPLYLAIALCLMPQRPALAQTAPLPAGTLPQAAPTFVTSGQATATVNGSTLNVQQSSSKAVLNWNSFNVSSDAAVNFQQPDASSVALNRIYSADPSVIQGQLNANGQIYLVNQNGIVFGDKAQVNVNTLVGSTLDISDQNFQDGILAPSTNDPNLPPVFEGGPNGKITVEAGAQIKSATGGRVMLLAPTVENNGTISTPDGQTVLAAGQKVYLSASSDPSLRGVVVEVDGGGLVSNSGTITAKRGNVSLIGLAVNQSGRITATTSVNANGSVVLKAQDSTTIDTSTGGFGQRVATETGELTLSDGSVTEVLPELEDSTTSVDAQQFLPSQVKLTGKTIALNGDALIHTPGGKVTLTATQTPDAPPFQTPGLRNDSRIYLDAGSRIDVSGTKDVAVPVERNFVQVELRGNELKDSPLQRNSFLRGETVTIDTRRGTPLADVSGNVALVGRTVAERTANGGSIVLQSQGDVIQRSGSTLDVSGGSLNYQPGYASATQLYTPDGKVVDIGDASPDVVYAGFADRWIEDHPRWGMTETFMMSGSAHGQFQPGYIEGRDAGSITIIGSQLVLDGEQDGYAGPSGEYQLDPGKLPAGGRLTIGDTSQLVSAPSGPDLRTPDVVISRARQSLPGSFDVDTALPTDRADTLSLNADFIDHGFTRAEIYSNGSVTLAQNTDLTLAPGGSITLSGSSVDVNSNITAPGGSITLAARSTFSEQGGDATVAPGVQLSTRGNWINDSALLNPVPAQDPLVIDGGSIAVTAFDSVVLGSNSLLDASGGAYLDVDSKLRAGKGGSIRIAANAGLAEAQPGIGSVTLGGTLQAYGIEQGGSLSVSSTRVQIGGAPTGQTGELYLTPDFFTRGGFAAYSVTGRDGLTLAANTTVQPVTSNLTLNPDYVSRASGSDLLTFSRAEVLDPLLRGPTDISLSASDRFYGSLLLDKGSVIRTDPGAAVKLAGGLQLTVLGTVDAPAGSIDLSLTDRIGLENDVGYLPGQSIWLGSSGQLLARGVAQTYVDDFGVRRGEVLDGGDIRFNIATDDPRASVKGYVVTEAGSVIDVSGTQAKLDLPQPNGSLKSTSVASNAGSVVIRAREGALLDGTLIGKAGGANAAGGTFALAIDRQAQDFSPIGVYYPTAERTLILTDTGTAVPAGLTPGAAVPLALNGQARFNTGRLSGSGFDALYFKSQNRIEFQGDVELDAGRSLALDAPVLAAGAGAQANLAAPYVALGNTDTRYQQSVPAASGGSGSLNVQADLIDVQGQSALQGFGHVALSSTGDIRLRGVLDDNVSATRFLGGLRAGGDLDLTAAQIYPTTLTEFTITTPGDVRIQGTGDTPDAPLSALGQLSIKANNIQQGGVLRAPLGKLSLEATNSLTLSPGSISSVSAEGRIIPFGQVQGGESLVYTLDAGRSVTYSVDPTGPERPIPGKELHLSGEDVDIQDGSTLNLSGGGDLYAYEFLAGPGGSRDVLSEPGTYAILPSLGSAYAPFDPAYSLSGMPAAGESVYISGVPGLPDGVYPLLPAHYALLPGGYSVQAVGGYQDILPSQAMTLADGSTLAAGYRVVAGTNIRDSRSSGYLVTPGDVVRKQSEYSDNYGGAFLTQQAQREGVALPPIPADAGLLTLAANQSLQLDGDALFTPGTNGRGGQADITADKIAVVSAIGPSDGFLQLTADTLNNLQVDSLLLGGTRSSTADGVAITTGASEIEIRNDANTALMGEEILLTAEDRIDLKPGSVIRATGTSSAQPADIQLSGNGAFVRVAAGAQADFQRSTSGAPTGTLNVESGAQLLTGKGSLILEGAGDTYLGDQAVLQADAVSLSARRISLGAAPTGTEGLLLTDALLNQLGGIADLRLRSATTLDFYGATSLGLSGTGGAPRLGDLTLDADGLRGFGAAGDQARVQAKNITLLNTGTGSAGTASGSGSLLLDADAQGGQIIFGAGSKSAVGFAQVSAKAGEIVGDGSGSLAVSGDLDLQSARVTLNDGATQSWSATGSVTVDPLTGATLAPTSRPGLGGSLAIAGRSIAVGGTLDAPGGRLSLTATGSGASDDVQLKSGAIVRAGGQQRALGSATAYVSGGNVSLTSQHGDVDVQAGALVDVSAAAQGGDAGSVSVSATQGSLQLVGDLRGQAGARSQDLGGSFTADVGTLSDFSTLNSELNQGGFNESRELRVRQGNVGIAAGDTVQARRVSIAADGGALSVAGTIDTGSRKNASIGLYARDNLTLQSTAQLKAGYAAGEGGDVTLATRQGSLDLKSGSTIDLSGQTGGSLLLRAPRTSGNTDIGITQIGSTITGAGEVLLEAVRTYGNNTLNAAFFSTVSADNNAYLSTANVNAIRTRLGIQGNALYHLRAGVEVRNAGDITLAADTDLSFRNQGEPGTLSILAGGNLVLNGILSDGFGSTARGAALRAGDSWSYRLVAGADSSAANPLAVVNGVGNISLANAKYVRTGTGNIDVAAGGNLTLGTNASIFTAGKSNPLAGYVAPAGATYTAGGGDVNIKVGGNITATANNQLINDWLRRAQDASGNGTWWSSVANFAQSVGALGGGDVTVSAGGNISNLSVVAPTNGRVLNGNVVIGGGGDLDVRAGGNIASGVYYVGRGQGRIEAGGSLVSGRQVFGEAIYPILALGDGQYDVRARGSIDLETVFNPTVAPFTGGNNFSPVFFTYGAGSAVNLSALTGDIVLHNNQQGLENLAPQFTGPLLNQIYTLYPGTLNALAVTGDISIQRPMYLYPSAQGNVDLLAGGSIHSGQNGGPGTIYVSDADPSLLPSPTRPEADAQNSSIVQRITLGNVAGAVAHSLPSLHANDTQPIRIIAAGGSIVGQPGQEFGVFPKAAHLEARDDIRDAGIHGQNLRGTDVTSFRAGGNISFTESRDSQGRLLPNRTGIQISGPGRVEVLAGHNVDLGTSVGIITTGNLLNPYLPTQGADILVGAGYGRNVDGSLRLPDYQALIAKYLDPATRGMPVHNYDPELLAYVQKVEGNTAITQAEAYAIFAAYDEQRQAPFLNQVLYTELKETGRMAGSVPVPEGGSNDSAYQRGYDAVATYFPATDYSGDIRLFASQIRTLAGGDIDLMAPGGLINAGLVNPPAGLTKTASELGIVTVAGGSINAFARDSFLINQSRVFTLGGGNILIWSSAGDIDAGRGAKTAVSAPPPLVTIDDQGNVVTMLQGLATGSGIGVIVTDPDITPGDVDLVAPAGEVNAGDAGIQVAGNLNIAAQRVLGADNIRVGGTSSGVPSTDTSVPGLAGIGNLTSEVASAVQQAIASLSESSKSAPAVITVEVIGLGE